MEAVEPHQLRVAREVLDGLVLRRPVLVAENPARVAPPEALLHGRVDVLLLVRVAVVVAVVRRPPQHALLRGGGAHEGQDELEDAVRLVGPVGEVAVEARGNPPHAQQVEPHAHRHIHGPGPHLEDEEAHEVHPDERDGREPVDLLVGARDGGVGFQGERPRLGSGASRKVLSLLPNQHPPLSRPCQEACETRSSVSHASNAGWPCSDERSSSEAAYAASLKPSSLARRSRRTASGTIRARANAHAAS